MIYLKRFNIFLSGNRRPGSDAVEDRPPDVSHGHQARTGTQDLQGYRRHARRVKAGKTSSSL